MTGGLMGEISTLIQEGILCDLCGVFNGEEKIKANGGEFDGLACTKVPGFPITCDNCKDRFARKYGNWPSSTRAEGREK
jgi:hypothetical protein